MKSNAKLILIPDSYKSTMTSVEACMIMEAAIREVDLGVEIDKIPIADGGEGSIDAILNQVKGRKVYYDVRSPLSGKINSYLGLIDNDETAIIEVAQAIGFEHKTTLMNPGNTSSYAIGELISRALDLNVKKIILCLGGSITNDGGCGIAACLGIKFYDQINNTFVPTGESLIRIERIDIENVDKRLLKTKLIALTDVINPLSGVNGAAYVYARQKGANDEMVKSLDKGLIHLSNLVLNLTKIDFSMNGGAGAAGGIGFGLKAFFGFSIFSGIDYFLDLVAFEKRLVNANYVITGEGKFDQQSLMGKAISGIYRLTSKHEIPLIVVAGIVDEKFKTDILVYHTSRFNSYDENVKLNAKEDLRKTMIKIISSLNTIKR